MLTVRGMRLERMIQAMHIRVVEIYPGGAQDVWGIPRAKRDIAGLLGGLRRLGLLGLSSKATADELDAASGALVGQLFLRGKAEVLGNFRTGAIILPRAKRKSGGKARKGSARTSTRRRTSHER